MHTCFSYVQYVPTFSAFFTSEVRFSSTGYVHPSVETRTVYGTVRFVWNFLTKFDDFKGEGDDGCAGARCIRRHFLVWDI